MSNKPKKNCPLPTTHARLNHVLSIFDDINKSYQEPVKFTSDLNNLIQALRNVTFMLQSEKGKIENFNEWYKPIQDLMKEDEVMKWLVNSRNHVVKQGDLEKDSYITVRIVNHYNHEIFTQKFDPFLSTDTAIQLFRKVVDLKFPEILKSEVLIEAEREWVVSSYPRGEVVDVLIYCFSILVNVVEKAHEIFGDSILTCEGNSFFDPTEDFMVVLRNNLKLKRSTRVFYESGNVVSSSIERITMEEVLNGMSKEEASKKVTEKYGSIKEIKKIMKPTNEEIPFCFIPYHLEMAKKFMLSDGGILPTCFLYFSKEEPPKMMHFVLSEPTARYSAAERIADMVEQTHCKAIIFLSEVWIGDLPKKGESYVPARYQKGKKEAISLFSATPTKTRHIHLPFSREGEKIILGKESVADDRNWPFFNKLFKVWVNQDIK